jgi:hypothetical protein
MKHEACEIQHHPLTYTARGVAASEHVPPKESAKTVIVIADDRSRPETRHGNLLSGMHRR